MNTAVASALAHAELAPASTRSRELTWQDPLPVAAAGSELSGFDYVSRIASGELPPPPIAVVMRMSIEEVERGRVVFAGEPSEEHYNPIGVVHGGYAATLLDSAMGSAVHTTLEPGSAYTTLTLETKFVRPITAAVARVLATGEVIHAGRRQATAVARLTDAGTGKLLAHATSTCLILG